ncbi:MAG: diguanylate cyclase [Acidobacteria bacterium]|nr:diguanylate cyclase [Acidobacteriota bacterium]
MKVLIADDDIVNRRILEKFLEKWGYEVFTATDGSEAWEMLQKQDTPRLVILDWMMPGLDGAQICREIRKRNDAFYTYIVMVTAKFQKQDILDGLEAGADDYLTKPFDSNELRARLRSGRRILELHEELLRSREQLQHQASHDAMTGVWNHAAILEILRAELARSRREKHSVGIVLLDLDNFKKVNDCYGHLAGDSVLREVVRRLHAHLRSYDFIGRYGGEEFLVVLPNSKPETAVKQAERLRLAISETPLDNPEGNIPITVSLGVSVSCGTMAKEDDSLLKAADVALYRAKNLGRNRVEAAWENPACLNPQLAAATANPMAGTTTTG